MQDLEEALLSPVLCGALTDPREKLGLGKPRARGSVWRESGMDEPWSGHASVDACLAEEVGRLSHGR